MAFEVVSTQRGYAVSEYNPDWRRDGRDLGMIRGRDNMSFDEARSLENRLTAEEQLARAKATVARLEASTPKRPTMNSGKGWSGSSYR